MNGPVVYKRTRVYLIGILRIKLDHLHFGLKNQIRSTIPLASYSKFKSACKTADLNLEYEAYAYKTADLNLEYEANGLVLQI